MIKKREEEKAQKDRIVHPVDIDSAYRSGRFHCHECFYRGKRCVEGNELYSSTQIENMVLNDEYSWNSPVCRSEIQICGYRGSSVCRYDGGFTGQSPYRTY